MNTSWCITLYLLFMQLFSHNTITVQFAIINTLTSAEYGRRIWPQIPRGGILDVTPLARPKLKSDFAQIALRQCQIALGENCPQIISNPTRQKLPEQTIINRKNRRILFTVILGTILSSLISHFGGHISAVATLSSDFFPIFFLLDLKQK